MCLLTCVAVEVAFMSLSICISILAGIQITTELTKLSGLWDRRGDDIRKLEKLEANNVISQDNKARNSHIHILELVGQNHRSIKNINV